jgi:hypothetical protein
MTSPRQIAANQINARKSCGPKTEKGKLRSRRNAIRHGLTAKTVVGILESAEDYQQFEDAICADYHARSSVERELVTRLASLLWRLRRATAIETGLLQIQAKILQERKRQSNIEPEIPNILYRVFADRDPSITVVPRSPAEQLIIAGKIAESDASTDEARKSMEFARCFLRITNIHDELLERLNRYESALWRQAREILCVINVIRPPVQF